MPREEASSPQPLLLGLLMTEPKHGYGLYQEFRHELGRVWRIGMSQLYAQLKQLEDAGLVAAQTELQDNRPPRKVYSVTADGREAFHDWVHTPTPYLRQIRVEFLARLYFFQKLSLEGLEWLVAEQKAVCLFQIEEFERQISLTDDRYRRVVLDFRRGQLEAVERWLDRSLETLSVAPTTQPRPASEVTQFKDGVPGP
jgi:PadR family transcriptional regulator AphA